MKYEEHILRIVLDHSQLREGTRMFVAAPVTAAFLALSFVQYSVVGNLDSSITALVADFFAYKRVRMVRSFACKTHGTFQ